MSQTAGLEEGGFHPRVKLQRLERMLDPGRPARPPVVPELSALLAPFPRPPSRGGREVLTVGGRTTAGADNLALGSL